jgi:autotransporter-associated beta strand protein
MLCVVVRKKMARIHSCVIPPPNRDSFKSRDLFNCGDHVSIHFILSRTVAIWQLAFKNLFSHSQLCRAPGSGGLILSGGSPLILSGPNTYTGSTLVNAGTLQLLAGVSVSTSTNITLAAGITLDMQGTALAARCQHRAPGFVPHYRRHEWHTERQLLCFRQHERDFAAGGLDQDCNQYLHRDRQLQLYK